MAILIYWNFCIHIAAVWSRMFSYRRMNKFLQMETVSKYGNLLCFKQLIISVFLCGQLEQCQFLIV